MPPSTDKIKPYAQLSLGALGLLFLLSIVWYKSRLYFADTSFILFNILKNKMLYIQEHRYGSIITQMFPYFGCKMHVPLPYVLKAYAFSFNFFYLVAGIVVYRCRQYGMVVLMALYYYLLVSDTFFWPTNEIQQAIAWMFLFFAATLRMMQLKVKNYYFYSVFLLLLFITVFTHFIVLIPLLFLWGFYWIRHEGWPWTVLQGIVLSTFIIVAIAVRFAVVNQHSYDIEHLHNVAHLSFGGAFKAFFRDVVTNFVFRCFTNYWVIWMVLPLGLIYIIRSGQKWLTAWVVVSMLGYVALMGITYDYKGRDTLLYHMESEWQSLGIIISAPFVYYFLPAVRLSRGLLLLAFIFAVRLCYIGAGGQKYFHRYEFLGSVMAQMRAKGITKLGLYRTGNINDICMLTWAIPDESMLMSAMHRDDPQINFFITDPDDSETRNKLSNPKIIYAAFEPFQPSSWNFTYYKPDTIRPYVFMTYEELFR
jgi:hypothetical protein